MNRSLSLREIALASALLLAGCAVSNPDATKPGAGAQDAPAPAADARPAGAGASDVPRPDIVVNLAELSPAPAPAPATAPLVANASPTATPPAAAVLAPAKRIAAPVDGPVVADESEPTASSGGGAAALNAYPDEGTQAARPISFRDAVARAADELLAQARNSIGSEPRRLVIDPLVDGRTGQQTASTVEMGRILADLTQKKYPSLKPAMLTRVALEEKPVLFIGTLTPFNTAHSKREASDAFRVWLTLIDLRTGRIIAKSVDRATAASVDAVPLSFYRDSPTWSRDKTVTAYINSCKFGTKVGDLADPAYLAHLPAAAAINEALLAYTGGQMSDANRLFHEAATLADTDDLRILNGLYLTSWNLGRQQEARSAFDQIVSSGIKSQRLQMKFLFTPAKTTLLDAGDLSAQYNMWLRELARRTAEEGACLNVVGHTSRTGTAAINDPLSLARASRVRELMASEVPGLSDRLSAQGRGSRENLIGLGTDDLRDALDRRVELIVRSCTA